MGDGVGSSTGDGIIAATTPRGRADDSGGRDMAPGTGTLAFAIAAIGGVVGLLLLVVSFTSWRFGAWIPREQLTTGLVGAAMAGVAPGLLRVNAMFLWEETRSLFWPVAVAVPGLFAVSAIHQSDLALHGGADGLATLFSLGWLLVLLGLSVFVLIAFVQQMLEPALPPDPAVAPLPGWAKPLLALLGSAWLGAGMGLLLGPSFWGRFVPWRVSTLDAQALGVWSLALGVGVLGALAEDDLARVRPALTAVVGAGVALAVVLLGHAGVVDWSSIGGIALVVLVGGLLATGAVGTLLWRSARLAP
ncbi:MAG: hypothetical protein QM572_18140 [Nocardioides sp.]|uniref:hypothetical protein n=1 Tax=Nocardioides sp. TaxID=35761 RepID=UPI0039E66800